MAKQPCGNPCSSCAAKLSCSASQINTLRGPTAVIVEARSISATEVTESAQPLPDSFQLSGRDVARAYLAELARAEAQA